MKTIKIVVGNFSAKIYPRKRPGADGKNLTFYQLAYTDANKKRKLLGFKDEDRARAEARRIAGQLASGQTMAASMTNIEAAGYGRAVQLLPSNVSLELAASVYSKAVEILGGDNIIEAAKFYAARHRKTTPKPVSEVIAELLAVKQSRGAAARYHEDLRNRLNRVGLSFKKNAGDVTTSEIQSWLDAQGFSGQGYCDYRNRMNLLFNFAVARGYALDNPVNGVEKVKVRRGEVEIYSPEEIGKLLAAATEDFIPCLAIGAFAGLRSQEIERLEWSDIDLAGRHITVSAKKSKTASRRLVPISDNLVAWLTPYVGRQGAIWAKSHFDFYHIGQQDTAKAANVAWRPNALRHSYASYRFAQTGDAGRVAGELGNSAVVVHRHYRELVKPSQAEAWFSVKPEGPANIVSMPATAVAL